MKTLKVVRYNMSSVAKSIVLFYSILAAMTIITMVIAIVAETDEINSNFIDMSSWVYSMVIGVVFFTEYFKMYLQNGISRKTMFKGYILTFGAFAAGLAVIETLFALLSTKLTFIKSMLDLVYGQRFGNIPFALQILEAFLIYFAVGFFALFFGLFLGILFTKLSKVMKAVIPVSFSLGIILLMTLDGRFWNWAVAGWFGEAFKFMGGFAYSSEGMPYFLIVSCICIAGVFSLFSWLMMRRATLKDN